MSLFIVAAAALALQGPFEVPGAVDAAPPPAPGSAPGSAPGNASGTASGTAPDAPSGSPAPAGAVAPSSSLPGVVVQGRRRPCGARDSACATSVVKEIWARYPEKIAIWCAAEQTRRFRQNLNLEALGGDPGTFEHGLPPAEEELCDYGDTIRAKGAAPPAPPAAPAAH